MKCSGSKKEMDPWSCDDAAGGVSSTLLDLTIACGFCLGQAEDVGPLVDDPVCCRS